LDDKGSFSLWLTRAVVLRPSRPGLAGLSVHGSVRCSGEPPKSFESG
jgi:hypothetical protein